MDKSVFCALLRPKSFVGSGIVTPACERLLQNFVIAVQPVIDAPEALRRSEGP